MLWQAIHSDRLLTHPSSEPLLLALQLLCEKHNTSSFWTPYISMHTINWMNWFKSNSVHLLGILPRSFNTCLSYSLAEIQALRGSPAFLHARRIITTVAKHYSYVFGLLEVPTYLTLTPLSPNVSSFFFCSKEQQPNHACCFFHVGRVRVGHLCCHDSPECSPLATRNLELRVDSCLGYVQPRCGRGPLCCSMFILSPPHTLLYLDYNFLWDWRRRHQVSCHARLQERRAGKHLHIVGIFGSYSSKN